MEFAGLELWTRCATSWRRLSALHECQLRWQAEHSEDVQDRRSLPRPNPPRAKDWRHVQNLCLRSAGETGALLTRSIYASSLAPEKYVGQPAHGHQVLLERGL